MQVDIFHMLERSRAERTGVWGLLWVCGKMHPERVCVGGAFSADMTGEIHLSSVMLQVLLQTSFPGELLSAVMAHHFQFFVDGSNMLLEGLWFPKCLSAHVTDAGFVVAGPVLVSQFFRLETFPAHYAFVRRFRFSTDFFMGQTVVFELKFFMTYAAGESLDFIHQFLFLMPLQVSC